MELRPSDLGIERNVALIQQRATVYASTQQAGRRVRNRFARNIATSGGPPGEGGGAKPLGRLGRLWARMAGMDEETARAVLAGTGQMTNNFAIGFGAGSLGFFLPGMMFTLLSTTTTSNMPIAMGPMFVAMGVAFSSIGVVAPGNILKKWHQTPITPGEVEGLLADTDAEDTLERAYLALLRDALQLGNAPREAEENLRAAIRALGEAIDRLPLLSSVALRVDADKMRQEAAAAQAEADAESDRVIAGSKARRAEALARSAKAAGQSALLLRRAAALREELAAQTEALRLGMAAFYTGTGDISDLSHLSESVRSVASEASSVADARAEIEALSSPAAAPSYAPAAAVESAAAQPQRVGRGLS